MAAWGRVCAHSAERHCRFRMNVRFFPQLSLGVRVSRRDKGDWVNAPLTLSLILTVKQAGHYRTRPYSIFVKRP